GTGTGWVGDRHHIHPSVESQTRCGASRRLARMTTLAPHSEIAVDAVFASLGRYLLCLDELFRVVHASPGLREAIDGDAIGPLEGRPVADILGRELFGPGAPLREALVAGERGEGWRALLATSHGIRPMAITAAAFKGDVVRFIIVLRSAEEDHASTSSAPTVFSGLIARSSAMARIFQLIENLQGSDATVLLTGESGTGKEAVARAIHEHSPRRRGPFIAVNCGALPAELMESELFGHMRGAFAGAVRDRVGRFDLASQGTIFLDEIAQLPTPLQVKLLRVLEEHMFERAGEGTPRVSEARVIAATNIDLREAVGRGLFRDDLYYRLRVVPIEIPPLRARREDIEPLARFLLRRVGDRHGRQFRFAPEAIRVLLNYKWPGNVRELENAIEYAVAVGRTQIIHPEDLPAELAGEPAAAAAVEIEEQSELQRLRAALESNRWRREDTARTLGISRATLWRRMREFGLL
ncbi:MAG TPA: sigma-54 dependent transcriptional regulator, partial [Thermoanaerobaculia bacterium]|nr:sigma-54 dependent transcriptional regulator [Thermoanaerobaculia bacterium]